MDQDNSVIWRLNPFNSLAGYNLRIRKINGDWKTGSVGKVRMDRIFESKSVVFLNHHMIPVSPEWRHNIKI